MTLRQESPTVAPDFAAGLIGDCPSYPPPHSPSKTLPAGKWFAGGTGRMGEAVDVFASGSTARSLGSSVLFCLWTPRKVLDT